MKPFTKDEYRAAKKFRVEWVPLPHLGEDRGMFVRMLSARERNLFQVANAKLGDTEAPKNHMARFVALCASDEHGTRMFTDDDAGWLGDDPGGGMTLDMVYDAGRLLNRMYLTEEELKESEKNCVTTPEDSSSSGSPESSEKST